MAQAVTVPVKAEVEIKWSTGAVAIRPGDKLVVAVNKPILTYEEVEEYTSRLSAMLPGVDIVVIPAAALAVYREGEGPLCSW